MECHSGFKYSALAASIVSTALALLAPAAQAGTVICPGTLATTDREFSLTTSTNSVCLASGTGNLSGNGDAINALNYLTLDKSDDAISGLLPNALTVTGSGTTSGTFSFTINAPGFKDFVIALKSGAGQLDPDWAAFSLPTGVTSGSWAISGSQSLSHLSLYGHRATPVPVPAALWLLGSALVSVGAASRRKSESV